MSYTWTEQNQQIWQNLKKTIDKQITSVCVNLYLFQAEEHWDNTPIQLHFADGSVVYLDGDSAGESLRLSTDVWHDPFSGKLDVENTLYIQQFGCWIQKDVSGISPFDQIIRKSISAVHPIFNRFGTMNGVQFIIENVTLNFVVDFDECQIVWGESNPVLQDNMYTVIASIS